MKTDRKRCVIRLSKSETKKWESGAPAGFEFRKSVRDIARGMTRACKKHVEIYASESEGGWMADQIEYEREPDFSRDPS